MMSYRHRLVVVGDAFLDRDHVGARHASHGLPVVADADLYERPGGAGLAATMAAGLPGWRVTLVTALGANSTARRVERLVGEAGIAVVDLSVRDGRTGAKCRLVADGTPVARYDHPHRVRIAADADPAAVLARADAVLVSDYGLGMTASPVIRTALSTRVQGAPLVWDPHARGGQPVAGASVVTPSAPEAVAAIAQRDPAERVVHATVARRLRSRWNSQSVAITLGAKGAILVDDRDDPFIVRAPEVVAGDTCGAGDMLSVVLVTQLATGRSPRAAVERAVTAATTYVKGGGPRVYSTAPGAATAVERRRTVATAGCFDLLHAGHLRLLRHARALGDRLVVVLNSDRSVRRLKGPERPIIAELERAAMLAALEVVDDVIVFDEDTPAEALSQLRPDVYVKGGDYRLDELPERTAIESYGGRVVICPLLLDHSTSALVHAIRDASEGGSSVPAVDAVRPRDTTRTRTAWKSLRGHPSS